MPPPDVRPLELSIGKIRSMPVLGCLVIAEPGESVGSVITKAMSLLKKPATPYAYFQHNGVIVTMTRKMTEKQAYQMWSQMLGELCVTSVDELPAN